MSAYVIAEIEVVDPAAYEEYRKQVLAVVTKYGGKFLVRGGQVEPREGGWTPKRIVVLSGEDTPEDAAGVDLWLAKPRGVGDRNWVNALRRLKA